jgi:predicted Rossmann fold flavoprotein|tara:strand:- start:565 stop:1755 length:1191 start_codon:yes stop_codon:yes gene_type:complete
MDFDTVIIGAGAAGMMCAAQAPGRCLVIEHAKVAGEKIRISGGGRCNFTNIHTSPENYISQNPHFVKSALARYTQWDFIDWIAQNGIAYHEKTLGQLFCDTSANEIISMLTTAIENAGGQVLLNTSVQNVVTIEQGYTLNLNSPNGQTSIDTHNLVVACGGKPIPKMGATDYGLRLAQQFGLSITRTYAGLVPFTFSGKQQEDFNEISGVTVPAKVSTNIASFDEGILFTHRGLSGPASLQASSYWKLGENITISLLDESRLETTIKLAKEKEGRKSPHNILTRLLPARLVPKIIKDLELPARIADVDTNQLTKLCNRLSDWQLAPSGTEGYRTAEVMVGGVDTNGLSSKTMMAKNQKGLYFIGECVDVTGWLGGYNFQWAWSSGWVAGQSIRNLL